MSTCPSARSPCSLKSSGDVFLRWKASDSDLLTMLLISLLGGSIRKCLLARFSLQLARLNRLM